MDIMDMPLDMVFLTSVLSSVFVMMDLQQNLGLEKRVKEDLPNLSLPAYAVTGIRIVREYYKRKNAKESVLKIRTDSLVYFSYKTVDMRRIVSIIIYLALFGCKQSESDSLIPTIDIINAKHETVPMSRLFEVIEYVILETSDECLLDGKRMITWITDDYIVIVDYFSPQPKVLLFGRATGDFIKEIASHGRGSGEYIALHNNSFDEENLVLYFDCFDWWMGVDIETDERTYILKPKNMEKTVGSYPFPYQPFGPIFALKDGYFMTPMTNITGTDDVRLAVFDKEGVILRTYPNYQTFVPEVDRQSIYPMNAELYYRRDELYFYEHIDDTVHLVTPYGFRPHLVFDVDGKKRPHDPSLFVKGQDYYWLDFKKETDDYTFFSYYYGYAGSGGTIYTGYFDKEKNRTFVCDTSGYTAWGEKETVFLNDIDGLFNLSSIFKINALDESYVPISAMDVEVFMAKSKQTGDVADKLSKVKETDNPVIMIAKLK